jgi:tRNA pseudouridine55 synthase
MSGSASTAAAPTGERFPAKRVKRKISGVLLLDKPAGPSSNAALQHAKRLFQAEKAGHTGNLDPIATGLLPLCFGEATKFSQFLLDSDKSYQALIKLGQTTTTGDAEGEVLTQQAVDLSRARVEAVLPRFVGRISQTPPMYSALKYQGKALYTYARAGVEVERQSREVTIYDLQLDAFAGDELRVTVTCSKGTYIRVLAEDIGKALGCGAFMKDLRRTRTGLFELAQAVTLPELEDMDMEQRDALLLPPDCLLQGLDAVTLDAGSAYYLAQGQPIWRPQQSVGATLRVYDDNERFLGIGEVTIDGKIAPKRLVATVGTG